MYRQAFIQRSVNVFISPYADRSQRQYAVGLLCRLSQYCEPIPCCSLDEVTAQGAGGAVSILIVSSLQELGLLEKVGSLDCPTLVVYLFREHQFRQIDRELLRRLTLAGLSVIYPNEDRDGLLVPSEEKVLDTVFHKVVGPKYRSVQISCSLDGYLGRYPERKCDRIRRIGRFLKERDLNPDSTAGAIALRHGRGLLITATSTDKYAIPEDRICFVADYDSATNTVTWAGRHPPSSESPVAFLAFREFGWAEVLLHFHCKTITYSPNLRRFRTDRYAAYGTHEEAVAAVETLRATADFVILNGHGEIVLSRGRAGMEERVLEIAKTAAVPAPEANEL